MQPNDKIFEYAEHKFKPYGKIVIDKKKMSSDRELGITSHDWGKHDYSFSDFYVAAGDNCITYTVFQCDENGKFYTPDMYELYQYDITDEK
jgi:hypothetical protein